jgi:hypothetical protein
MSKRTPAISVLTANRLHDGIVVFLDAEGAWVQGIDGAAVARSPDEAEALQAQGARDAAANLVVEPYLAEVRESGGRLVPVRFRERVRVEGPSILGDVPGYVAPSPRAEGVRPLAPNLGATLDGGGEGSDPFVPASGKRESRASAEREPAEAA